jgi:hypothetical protein
VFALSRDAGTGHVHHLLMTSSMSVAMMSPLAIPVCVSAGRSSLWCTSSRCIAAAYGAFIGAWIAAGAVLHVVTEVAVRIAPAEAVAVVLATWCALDVMSRRRSVRLSACAVSRPLFPGSAGVRAVDLGAVAASRCVSTCWAPMALAVAQPTLGVPVAVVIVSERVLAPRNRWSIAVAFCAMTAWIVVANWR